MFWPIWLSSGIKTLVFGKWLCLFHLTWSYLAVPCITDVFVSDRPLFLCCLCVTQFETVLNERQHINDIHLTHLMILMFARFTGRSLLALYSIVLYPEAVLPNMDF
jgi:hypothetical protein